MDQFVFSVFQVVVFGHLKVFLIYI